MIRLLNLLLVLATIPGVLKGSMICVLIMGWCIAQSWISFLNHHTR
jgi:hypothetical protein